MTEPTPLFRPLSLGTLDLPNRVVMAPMTRCRAIGNIPNQLMADYYAARASAGLLITEGTAPTANGLGYARIPGLYSDEQVAGWKLVTDAVHAAGGRIFVQLMHVGRVGHPANVPAGAHLEAPSAIAADGQMWTDSEGMQPQPVPREMTTADIEAAIEGIVQSCRLAIEAGFDGVELHAANGYLLNQFLNPRSNQRQDAWGGSAENRNRFVLEVARRAVEAIGGDRVGIRLSPYGVFNDLLPFEGIEEQYVDLAQGLGALGLVYVHLVDHSGMGAPAPTGSVVAGIRSAFLEAGGGHLILSGGYDRARADAALADGAGSLVAFGRPFIANPDLVEKLQTGAALAEGNPELFYTPGPEGYLTF